MMWFVETFRFCGEIAMRVFFSFLVLSFFITPVALAQNASDKHFRCYFNGQEYSIGSLLCGPNKDYVQVCFPTGTYVNQNRLVIAWNSTEDPNQINIRRDAINAANEEMRAGASVHGAWWSLPMLSPVCQSLSD